MARGSEKKVQAGDSAPAKKSVEEVRMDVWSGCLKTGWVMPPQQTGSNILERLSKEGRRTRLRFCADALVMEAKRPLKPEERKAMKTCVVHVWDEVGKATYEKVTVASDGDITLAE